MYFKLHIRPKTLKFHIPIQWNNRGKTPLNLAIFVGINQFFSLKQDIVDC